jgi:hypothetical protein
VAKKTTTYSIGDRVAYSAAWLRNTGQRTSKDNIGGWRGTVKAVAKFGDNQLVTIDWGFFLSSEYYDDGFGRVIAPNLTLVSRIGIDSGLNT